MKKYIIRLLFLLALFANITLIYLFALTGSYMPIVLLPFGIAFLMLTLEELK